ncbi:HNH endonuclease [Paenibacillus sp. S150]|uniref:HNH endonuclease n=1 Tax=Paenibacillus sp. S150 TaxID=2749826 RepID=UPI001C57EEFD|nr:HNH endonuclease [Paenibacillus sp. S150]MBW4083546.1 HNH endonuclease [Paenibacillus sp. S150]
MIKIQRTDPPTNLTQEKIERLTAEYMETNKNVWNQDYIKNALMKMSHNKCIFCECKLGEESKYIEVEHFHPKSLYPEEVVDWENLLPICKRCNGLKRDHDTKMLPIINPTLIDPKAHLTIKGYRFSSIDDLGKRTIRVLGLNDSDRLFLPRVKIGNEVSNILDGLVRWVEKIRGNNSTEDENELIGKMYNILKSCQPDSEYSTICSYALFRDDNYYEVKEYMQQQKIWNDDLSNLEEVGLKNCLIEHPASHSSV